VLRDSGMARGMKALLVLAAPPWAAALQAQQPGEAELQAYWSTFSSTTGRPEAFDVDSKQAPQLAATGVHRSHSDTSMCAMLPDFEKGRNLRVGSTPNATLNDCALCVMNPHESPKLWFQEGTDGVGTRVHNMIMGMAVAHKNGMNVAGFVSVPFECPIRIFHGFPFGVDCKLVYDFFFGLNSTDLFVNMRQAHVEKYKNMQELEKYTGDVLPFGRPDPLASGSQSLIDQPDINMQFGSSRTDRKTIRQYLSPDFVKNLRAMGSVKVMTRPTWFATDGRPTVAVHVRRADVKQKSANNHRWTPDSWYLDKIAKIKHQLPNADVHVFTSVDEETERKDLYFWNTTSMTLHTDEDKTLAAHATMDAWAHFAQADFVILSRSSYGHVPAMLNTNCVIYQEYWNAPMEGWIWAEDSEQGSQNLFDQGALNACIRRIARPSWGILGAQR